MARKVVKILGPAERDMLEPHIEAVRRYERVIAALGPPGSTFDPASFSYYIEVSDAPDNTQPQAREWPVST